MAMVPGDASCTLGLSREIKTAILSACGTAQDNAELDGLCYAIASAIVLHISVNAEVVPQFMAPPGGGPVTGTGTIQ